MKICYTAVALAIILAPNCLLAAKPTPLETMSRRLEAMEKLFGGRNESRGGRRNEAPGGRRNESEKHWADQNGWISSSESDSKARSHWQSLHEGLGSSHSLRSRISLE